MQPGIGKRTNLSIGIVFLCFLTSNASKLRNMPETCPETGNMPNTAKGPQGPAFLAPGEQPRSIAMRLDAGVHGQPNGHQEVHQGAGLPGPKHWLKMNEETWCYS